MNISSIANINFKAKCTGLYKTLIKTSVKNGLPKEDAENLAQVVQNLFPDNSQTLQFTYGINTYEGYPSVNVKLVSKDNKLLAEIKNSSLDINKTEKERLFPEAVNLVKRLKILYDNQLQKEAFQTSKGEAPIKPIFKKKVQAQKKYYISHIVDKIKKISTDAGLIKEEADKIQTKIEKIFSKKQYNEKELFLVLDEDNDNLGQRRYILYHIIDVPTFANKQGTSLLNPNDSITEKIKKKAKKDYISEGYTKEDRKKLFENLCKILARNY